VSEGLRGADWQYTYGPSDDRLHSFYIPALQRSVRYDRSAGFFSSAALAVAAAGIAHLIARGGHMRLLVGAQLEQADIDAVAAGEALESRVAARMLEGLAGIQDALMRERHACLAWMVAEGTLEMRVVLPKGPDNLPLPADEAAEYFHPKQGVFVDEAGDRIAFSGSANESVAGWVRNYELLEVYRSWDASAAYLVNIERRFEELWSDRDPDWIALNVPDAVRQRLLAVRPSAPPLRDPLERPTVRPPAVDEAALKRDRIMLQFLRDAAQLPAASRFGAETSAITPWPHQHRVADALVERFPERFLVCDEVGLGKTIEAGLLIRQLLLSRRAERILLLAPASILRQWQEELYEKFALDVPRYDGTTCWGYFGDERPLSAPNPFDAFACMLVSAQLAKRPGRREQLLSAQPFDLVIVDEAHHARRRDFLQLSQYRPNRLLELLSELRKRTRSLLLLTATPMQVHPVEVWDLLRLAGLGGRWGARDTTFLRFFTELRKGPDEVDWDFVCAMVRDEARMGGTLDPAAEDSARERLGLVDWEWLRGVLASSRPAAQLRHADSRLRTVALEVVRQQTPVRRLVFRNTRELLRRYHARGILRETVPVRSVAQRWVTMRPDEDALYRRIEEYISHFYARYENERKGLGFIMTVYRRRLTSSFYAITRSLERRLAFLTGRPEGTEDASEHAVDPLADLGIELDDVEQDDLDLDVGEEPGPTGRDRFRDEIVYVEDFLRELRGLGTDSKLERLHDELREVLRERDSVVVFTQYTDTMDYLRDALRDVYGRQVACFSGRGGERWRNGRWELCTKEELKRAFRSGEEVKILLCTEAASEGLNLQTCGVLINYDMPWNPMRVEQRIGRIDRIGQRYAEVWVRNYFYDDTVEALVYQRLADRIEWFVNVVGELQPILAEVARTIERVALTPREERERQLAAEISRIRQDLAERRFAALDLDEYADDRPAVQHASPLSLDDLARVVTGSPTLSGRFRSHPTIPDAYLLKADHREVAVTFSRSVFDEHPDTVRFLVPGDRVYEALLAGTPGSADVSTVGATSQPTIVRAEIAGVVPRVAYYARSRDSWSRVDTFATLEPTLERLSEDNVPWTGETLEEIERDAAALGAEDTEWLRRIVRLGMEGDRLALQERARDILLRAAHVELALGQQLELMGSDYPWEFGPGAIDGLRRHKYPWAPMLQLVDVSDLSPAAVDAYQQELAGEAPERLRRRFAALTDEANHLLRQLVEPPGQFSFPEPSVRLEHLALPT
jgi:superfamily II DNA or RNA helicase